MQQLDQTKEDQIQNLTEALRTRNYRIDLLVLNAGIAEHEHPNVNACQIKRCVCACGRVCMGRQGFGCLGCRSIDPRK